MRHILLLCSLLLLTLPVCASQSPGDETHGIAGVGVRLGSDTPHGGQIKNHLVVLEVVDHSPAQKKGLKVGDEIVEIDGAKVAGMGYKDAVSNHMRGPLGSVVQLIVRRDGHDITYDIVRDIVPVPPAKKNNRRAMIAPWRLQAQIFNLGVQSNLIYRWNFLLRVVVSFVPLLGSVFLWNAVFAGKKEFAGYTFSSMVAYFITLVIVDTLTVPNEDDFQIAEDIREGRINALLLKPLEYRLYRFHLYTSARLVHGAFAAVPLAIAMIWLGRFYAEVPWLENLPWAVLAVIGAGLIQFYFCFALAMIAFWILDIGSITFILYSIEFLLGGHIFPVDALPFWLQAICNSLPFMYETFFPAAILIGHVHGVAMMQGFLWQWAWIAFFYVLSGILWKRGLRQYTAVGG